MRRIAPVAVALIIALAGCSQPAEETSAPATTKATAIESSAAAVEPTASTTTSTDAVPLKDEIEAPAPIDMVQDDAGALAFVRYYLDVQNWARATADPAGLADVCGPDNNQCEIVRGWIKQYQADGLTQYGGLNWLSLDGVTYMESPNKSTRIYHSTVIGDPGEVRDASGTFVGTISAFSGPKVFTMEWQDGKWIMVTTGTEE